MGLEPTTLSLGGQPELLAKVLNHVTACKRCAERVLACANLRVVAGKTGTLNRAGDPTTLGASPNDKTGVRRKR